MARELGAAFIPTPLGPLLAVADHQALHLLEFIDRDEVHGVHAIAADALDAVEARLGTRPAHGHNAVTRRAAAELERYFDGRLRDFTIPLAAGGTPFQRQAWVALREIPYGETRSYGQQAAAMGRKSAVRAVGRANGANRIAILIPCHRVIGADGAMTGYGAGVWRKKLLLALERGAEPPVL